MPETLFTVQLTQRQVTALASLMLTIHHKSVPDAVNGPPVLTPDEMRDLVQRLMAAEAQDA